MESLKFLFMLAFLPVLQLTEGFTVAVFEHAEQSYKTTGDAHDIIRRNLDYYDRAADFARSKGAEIIVFPEYGLFPPSSRKRLKQFLENIPDPNVAAYSPCKQPDVYSDRPILFSLSCLAQSNNMIIIADLGDIQACEGQKGCPKDGVFQFNTVVAFGRNGEVLGRYHKEHLFGEFGMDVPLVEQDPTFETDLGRFAMFVCFDIVFQRITEVARWKDINTILFPTMWIDSAPLFNSVQYFQGWAIGNNVSLLPANIHLPGEGSLGSAIMKGGVGAQVYTFNPDGNSKLLLADLREDGPGGSSIYVVRENVTEEWTDDGKDVGFECSSKVLGPAKNVYKDYRCQERDTTNITLTKLNKTGDSIVSCNNGMCCKLSYTANEMKENFYFGVYNGTYNAINRYTFAEENCFLARCDGNGTHNCVTFPMRSKTLFYKVHIQANFSTTFIYPSVMSSGMRFMPPNQWEFESSDKTASITIEDDAGKDLLTVGFKARVYERDPPYVR